MKFSVIIPVYNVEAYLRKCLDSVIEQTFFDYEVIIVDDESTDHSGQIADEYAQKYEKIHVIHQKNTRQGGARNTGIRAAKGEYVVFVDSDDYVSCELLKTLNYYLGKNNLDILVYDYVEVSEEEELLNTQEQTGKFQEISKKEFLMLKPSMCNKTLRREIFVENDLFFPEKIWYEDMTTSLRLGLKGERIGVLDEILYYYRQHPSSTMHNRNIERNMEIMQAFQTVLDFYEREKELENYYKELEWLCYLHVLYYSAFRLLDLDYNAKEMKILKKYCNQRFPDWSDNHYLSAEAKKDVYMKLVLDGKWISFYYKIGARNKIKQYLPDVLKQIVRKFR